MNQEIGSAIWQQLKSGTALTALLHGGTATGTASIYIDHAPDSAELPYVIVAEQTGQWSYTMGDTPANPSRFQSALWQVRAVSDKSFPKEAEGIDTQIDTRLHQGTPTIGGYHLQRVVRETDIRYTETSGGQLLQNIGALYRVDVQKS